MKEIGTNIYYHLRWQMIDRHNNRGLAYWRMHGKIIPRPDTRMIVLCNH